MALNPKTTNKSRRLTTFGKSSQPQFDNSSSEEEASKTLTGSNETFAQSNPSQEMEIATTPKIPASNDELDAITARFERQISLAKANLQQLRLKRNQHQLEKPGEPNTEEADKANEHKQKMAVWDMNMEDIRADIQKAEHFLGQWEGKFLECNLFKQENISLISQSSAHSTQVVSHVPTQSKSRPKLKLHKGVSTVPNFTLAYSKTTPFQTWYKTMFKPEIKPLCENEAEFLHNLKYYINSDCWAMVHPLMDENLLGHLPTVIETMDSVFKETKTRAQLHQEFTEFKQTICDVQRYTALKLKLFKKANPTLDAESNNFKEVWLDGLAPPIAREVARMKPSYLTASFDECLDCCTEEEDALKRLNVSYEVHPKSNANQSSTPKPSNQNNNDRKKRKPDKKKSQTPKVTSNSPGQSSSGIASKSNATPNAPVDPKKYAGPCNATAKCREEQDKHPYFACKNSQCKKCKTVGHTHLQCPQAHCSTCNKSGHDTKVHGLNRKTPVF
jgi:hypothetical protein